MGVYNTPTNKTIQKMLKYKNRDTKGKKDETTTNFCVTF